jgi:hypothetical protein
LKILRARQNQTGPHTTVVQYWGPEPIGAAQVDSLQMMYNGTVNAPSLFGAHVGYGISGQPELTDQRPWNSVQQATSAPYLGAAGPTVYPGIGLPGTEMPTGLGYVVPTDLGA